MVDDLNAVILREREARTDVEKELAITKRHEQTEAATASESDRGDQGVKLWRDRCRGLAEQLAGAQGELKVLRAMKEAQGGAVVKAPKEDPTAGGNTSQTTSYREETQKLLAAYKKEVEALKHQLIQQERQLAQRAREYKSLVEEAARKGREAKEETVAQAKQIEALKVQLKDQLLHRGDKSSQPRTERSPVAA